MEITDIIYQDSMDELSSSDKDKLKKLHLREYWGRGKINGEKFGCVLRLTENEIQNPEFDFMVINMIKESAIDLWNRTEKVHEWII